MATFISSLIVGLAIVVGIPTFIFFVEVLAAIILPIRASGPNIAKRPRVAVLIPAHNESRWILPTLGDIRPELIQGDRLLVVADNCTDDTAAIAGGAGAEVLVRHDAERVGKGYALDWGVRHLSTAPPDVLVVVDADCRVSRGAIDVLATTCAVTSRPAQALYLVSAPSETAINYQVAEFASRVKNFVRPLGFAALQLPCQLMGTGMAFPFDLIRSAELASGQIVEDLKLGLDLAQLGKPAVFCPRAIVTSSFPVSISAAKTQRQRWEHGHMSIILSTVPHLLYVSLVRRNLSLVALALDVLVPPLTFLGMLLFATVILAVLGEVIGHSAAALAISLGNLGAFITAVVLAWWCYGRDILPLRKIGSVASFIIGKIPLYRGFLMHRRESEWVRTERKNVDPKNP